ncbi:Retinol-binding protein 4 [Bienertia sinuspersici]
MQQESSRKTTYIQQKVVSKLGTSQIVQSHLKHDFPLRLMVGQLMLSMMQKRRFSHVFQLLKVHIRINKFYSRKTNYVSPSFTSFACFMADANAKMAHYCPIGALTWHDEHFIIPGDEVYDTLAQQRVGKYKKTHEQHYDLVPSGHSRSDWIKLVDHWFSPKVQKLSQIRKEAHSLQCRVHIMGSNSYANLRADYERS